MRFLLSSWSNNVSEILSQQAGSQLSFKTQLNRMKNLQMKNRVKIPYRKMEKNIASSHRKSNLNDVIFESHYIKILFASVHYNVNSDMINNICLCCRPNCDVI